jgi:DNA-binding transcriptional MerR regulator
MSADLGYVLVRRDRALLDLDTFARAAGLHPDLVRRLVALGLLEPEQDAGRAPAFPVAQLAVAARIRRLRSGLSLNYAAIGVVLDLLDRIADLEAALRQTRSESQDHGGRTWISTL